MSGACNEYASMADVEHMERTFEERCAPELAIIDQLEQMGTSVPELIDTQTSEMALQCVDILGQGFAGSFAELKASAEAELGIDVEKLVEKPLSRTSISKVKSGSEKLVDRDFKTKVSDRQKQAVKDHYNGKVPKFVREALKNPSKQLTRKEEKRLPKAVKDVLKNLRGQMKVKDGIDLNDQNLMRGGYDKEMQEGGVQKVFDERPVDARFDTGYPESAKHVRDAQESGKSDIITPDREGDVAGRRSESLKGVPIKEGKDRDEYPPAFSKEGGKGASVRHISRSDNRGSGRKTYGHYLKDVPDGKEVKIDPYIGFEDED